MTIFSVVRDVCAAVGVMVPNSVFASLNSNRTMQEMVALADEMAQRIAYDTRDWTELQTQGFFTGDGIKVSFPLPVDYKRMLLNSNVRISNNPNTPLTFIPNIDEWIERRIANANEGRGEWIISGRAMYVWPIVPVGVQVRFPYLDKNCITLLSGGFGDRFVNDGDSFRLDERLLKLGMTWQWKALKGSPYAEDMGSYSDALANAMGHDSPAPIIIGRLPISQMRVAYPWPVP